MMVGMGVGLMGCGLVAAAMAGYVISLPSENFLYICSLIIKGFNLHCCNSLCKKSLMCRLSPPYKIASQRGALQQILSMLQG